MKKTTAAAAAGAVALTATGAVSALFMTMGAAQSPAAASTEPVVLTEYVDQNGNPVEAPGTTGFEMPEIVVVDGPAADPIVTTEYVDTYVTAGASGEALASDGHAYDDDLDDDDEYEIDPVTGEYIDDDEDEIDPVTGEYIDDDEDDDEEEDEDDDEEDEEEDDD